MIDILMTFSQSKLSFSPRADARRGIVVPGCGCVVNSHNKEVPVPQWFLSFVVAEYRFSKNMKIIEYRRMDTVTIRLDGEVVGENQNFEKLGLRRNKGAEEILIIEEFPDVADFLKQGTAATVTTAPANTPHHVQVLS